MKVLFLCAAFAAITSAFSPAGRQLIDTPFYQKSAYHHHHHQCTSLHAVKSPTLPTLPNPYKNLPWVVERERARKDRRLELENAAMFRQIGIPEDASYEEVRNRTELLLAMAEGDRKRQIKIEIARDKIYQIRLNERIHNLGTDADGYLTNKWAERMSKIEKGAQVTREDSIDEFLDKKPSSDVIPRNIPVLSWFQSIIQPPDEAYRKRQLTIWGLSTLLCLINPPMTEYFARMNWLPAGGMMGYRGMPSPVGDDGMGGGYNPFRGRRNKKHQVQAMGVAIMIWVMAKSLSNWVVVHVPAMAASRSAEWFKFAIVQACLGVSTAYIQTYKEGESEGGELMF